MIITPLKTGQGPGGGEKGSPNGFFRDWCFWVIHVYQLFQNVRERQLCRKVHEAEASGQRHLWGGLACCLHRQWQVSNFWYAHAISLFKIALKVLRDERAYVCGVGVAGEGQEHGRGGHVTFNNFGQID